MKIQSFIAVLCVAVMSTIWGDTARAGDIPLFSESEALNLAQEWSSRVSQADSAGLEKLLDASYMHIHATGILQQK